MRILERLSEGPKKIIWYLGEHPDLLQRYTDLQGLARRTVQLLRRKWEQLRQALRFMVRERRAQRFPESDHKLAQAILYLGQYPPVCQPLPGTAVPYSPLPHPDRKPLAGAV